MNTNLKKLLSAILALSATHLAADTGAGYTNKTFLMPRSQGVNLPLEFTTFHELVHRCCSDKFGANFALTGYYQASNNKNQLGRYFGVAGEHKFDLSNNARTPAPSEPDEDFPVDINDIIHQGGRSSNSTTAAATIDLQPRQRTWGLTLNYHQDLDVLLCGLFIRANLPVASVQNDLDMRIIAGESSPNSRQTLEDYFKGNYTGNAATGSAMNKLSAAKIDGKQSVTGVADIDVALGYKFWNQDDGFVSLAIALTIPTGTESEGEYVWEPLVGNGGHFGLGADFDSMFRLWGDDCSNVDLSIVVKYRYLFQAAEHRVFGLKGRNWGQYFGLAQEGDNAVTPAANVLRLSNDITPGSQLDGIFNLAYTTCGFTLDLGYNLFFRERETTHLKGDISKGAWYVAARNWNTGNEGGFTSDDRENGSAVLTNNHIDLAAGRTPSQCTHSIYGSLGYTLVEWENPLLFGIGGKYEFASNRAALENWSVWAKMGISF